MRRPLLALPTLAVIALAGCSQVAALAPVGGNHLAEVRFAAIDVLRQKDVALERAPVCERASDGAIACAGTTTGGETVSVASPAEDPDGLTVTVGADILFTGSVRAVIDEAAS